MIIMKSIEQAAIENWEKDYGSGNTGHYLFNQSIERFKAGVDFAQRWIPLNELKPVGTNLLFKGNNANYSVGKFEFIEGKLAICTDLGQSIMEDSGFTHFRPITLK